MVIYMMKCKEYIKAASLQDALDFLKNNPTDTVIAAGATDLMVKARSRDWYQDLKILDISLLEELKQIKRTENGIEIGALVTIAELLKSEIIKEEYSILWNACKTLAGPQVRNKATIGGNLANACLAGDTIPALCVLDAVLLVASERGEKKIAVNCLLKKCPACLNHEEMSVAGCFYGIPAGKKTNLVANDLILKIMISNRLKDYKMHFEKVGRKQAGCMSKFTLAIALRKKENIIEDIRLSIGAALSDIHLETEICDKLIGSHGEETIIKEVADLLGDTIEKQVKNVNQNILYKAEVCRRLTRRTLLEMIQE